MKLLRQIKGEIRTRTISFNIDEELFYRIEHLTNLASNAGYKLNITESVSAQLEFLCKQAISELHHVIRDPQPEDGDDALTSLEKYMAHLKMIDDGHLMLLRVSKSLVRPTEDQNT